MNCPEGPQEFSTPKCLGEQWVSIQAFTFGHFSTKSLGPDTGSCPPRLRLQDTQGEEHPGEVSRDCMTKRGEKVKHESGTRGG